MHRYTGYPYLEQQGSVIEGVTILNNGFWSPSYPDEEFKFEPGNGLLDTKSIEEFLRGVRVEIPTEERQVTFTTGEAGRRAMKEALENYIREEANQTIFDRGLIEEMLTYIPDQVVIGQSRRRGRSSAQGIWNRLRYPDQDELPDSVTVTREFRTEQEAIAYLDSLSEEITDTEYEENTDIV